VIDRVCRQCQASYQAKTDRSQFCSMGCRWRWKTQERRFERLQRYEQVEKACAQCGKAFRPVDVRARRGGKSCRFCSINCRRKGDLERRKTSEARRTTHRVVVERWRRQNPERWREIATKSALRNALRGIASETDRAIREAQFWYRHWQFTGKREWIELDGSDHA